MAHFYRFLIFTTCVFACEKFDDQFKNLDYWTSVGTFSVGVTGRNIILTDNQIGTTDGHAVVIKANVPSSDRLKLMLNTTALAERNVHLSDLAEHTWRVYIPAFKPKQQAGVTAFLYNHNLHEIDFECGFGTTRVRSDMGIVDDATYVCALTSQSGAVAGTPTTKYVPIREGWHVFQLKSFNNRQTGGLSVSWYIDGVKRFSVDHTWPPSNTPDGVMVPYISVENLKFLADPPDSVSSVAQLWGVYDYYQFENKRTC